MSTHPLARLGHSAASGPTAIYSVCSAHPIVLEAAVRQAVVDGTALLVESTSNQVNQLGGYTGMRPADFRNLGQEIAGKHGLAEADLILGGDHLGPNPWQHLPAEDAMQRAEAMVAEYSRAAFVKIHLDTSMACASEHTPLSDEIIAQRAARLCKAAEENSAGEQRFYVIGTEVPTPGGATESLEELAVTTREAAEKTLEVHRNAFKVAGLEHVWSRVIALVVQPGVEFNHDTVIHYVSEKTAALRDVLKKADGLVFEAHSTDYQTPKAYENLVRDGFAILKVGPALTFAMREALFALAQIEAELVAVEKRSRLPEVLEAVMLDRPVYWEKHYHGSPQQQRVLRCFSYSDRVRYYWAEPRVRLAAETLLCNLQSIAIPETLLSSLLPEQYRAMRQGLLRPHPYELIVDRIQQVIRPYAAACYGARS